MAAKLGRQVTFYWGGNSPGDNIPGVREKGIAMNGEPVDVTSDEDSGWRTLLEASGQNEVNISISGVTKDNRLRTDWMNGRRIQPLTIIYEDGGSLTGDFRLNTFEDNGSYNEAMVFSAEFASTGAVTYTPPA